ncbi:hypothetical protein KUL25_18055 [Rhodobacteraceae bacterium N5(2021)]|nr:hypothetical protein [Gymnodinialimonas phycosphaerae]MBY4894667.1 hypothetical protein [Gymnodinialimonas phycosphaerae]
MLIDIFARRYEDRPLRESYEQHDNRLLVQAFRILSEDICPYYKDGKEFPYGVTFWIDLHSQLSRELGVTELSPIWYSYNTKWNGKDHVQTGKHTMIHVCESWMLAPVSASPDVHIKERLSLVELGFRQKEEEITARNSSPITDAERLIASLSDSKLRVPGGPHAGARAWREAQTADFRKNVDELNTRLRQAGYRLNYHNGFIQIASDDLVQLEVETPFWQLISDPLWKNIDLDMKEALDRRDSDGRDPAFYAARALESAIKIVSERNGWTHCGEKGAHGLINNLASSKNGFLEPWEGNVLKDFFTHVRNPFGHGPGGADMPELSRPQTQWAIEFSMSWIKNLILRL